MRGQRRTRQGNKGRHKISIENMTREKGKTFGRGDKRGGEAAQGRERRQKQNLGPYKKRRTTGMKWDIQRAQTEIMGTKGD